MGWSNRAASSSAVRPFRRAFARVTSVPKAVWVLGAMVAFAFLLPLISASSMTMTTIKIDGQFADWDAVLADPQNVLFDNTGAQDADTGMSADRNLGRVAYTWDSTSVYFYLRAAAPVSGAMNTVVYIDCNGNGKLDNSIDRIANFKFMGSKTMANPAEVVRYSTTNPAGDPITGDGVDELGTLGSPVSSATNGGSADVVTDKEAGAVGNRWVGGGKQYFEMRVNWSELTPDGKPAPLSFHFSVGNPGSKMDDNAGPGAGGSSSTAFTTLDVAPARQTAAKLGSTVTLDHTITQSGNITDTVQVAAFTASGWPCSILTSAGPVSSVTLRGNEATSVALQVAVPANATPGAAESAFLSVRSTFSSTTVDIVEDEIYPGMLTVYPGRASTIATGTYVDYRHVVSNLTSTAVTVDLSSLSRSGWTTEVRNGSSTTTISALAVPANSEVPVVLRVKCPAGATIGAQDTSELSVIAQGNPLLGDTVQDISTVRPIVDLAPNNSIVGNAGQVLEFGHVVTNNGDTTRTITLSQTNTQATWTPTFYDQTGLVATATPTYVLGPRQSADVVLRVAVPPNSSGVDTLTVSANEGATLRASAKDVITIPAISLATYADAMLQLPQSAFKLGAPVYLGESGSAGTGGYVYFSVVNPASATVLNKSGGFIVEGAANASFATTEGSPVGTYTASVYADNLAASTPLKTVQFTVSYDAGVTLVNAADASTGNQSVAVSSLLRNSNSANITNSNVKYTVWYDKNSSGVFDSGDSWIDGAGNAQVWDGVSAAVSHLSIVTVAPGNATDTWSINNRNFPYPGTYNVTASWSTASGVFIGSNASTFFSPGGPWAEFSIVKQLHSGQSASVAPGGAVAFDIVVHNSGDTTLTTVPLADTFSASDFAFVSASPSENTSTTSSLTWTDITTALGDIAPGKDATVTVNFTASSNGVKTNTATSVGTKDASVTLSPSSSAATVTVVPDTTAPVVTIASAPASANGSNGWFVSSPLVTLSANESVQLIEYSTVSATGPWTTYVGGFAIATQGATTVWARATDLSNNTSSPVWRTFSLDTVAPSTSDDEPGGWHTANTSVTLTPTDASSGQDKTYYVLNGGAQTEYSGAISVTTEGVNTLEYWTVDKAGNVESPHKSTTISIDKTAPTTTISGLPSGPTSQTVQVTLAGADTGGSGFSATYYRRNGGAPQLYGAPFNVNAPGTTSLEYWSVDVAGNAGSHETTSFVIDISAPDLTVGGVSEGGLYNAPVTPTASSTDPTAIITATLNGSAYTPGTPVGSDGTYQLVATATDPAGNSVTETVNFTLDTTAPTGTMSLDGGAIYTYDRVVAIDSIVSGATQMNFDTGSGFAGWVTYDTPHDATLPAAENTATVTVKYRDNAGNELELSDTIVYDITGPSTNASLGSGTYRTANVELTATDNVSGVSEIRYVLDGQPQATYTSSVAIVGDGAHTLEFWSVDKAGNEGAHTTQSYTIDTTAPDFDVVDIPLPSEPTSSPVTPAIDTAEPSYVVTATLDGDPYTFPTEISDEGTHTLVVTLTDPLGNSATHSHTFTIDHTAPVTTIDPAAGTYTADVPVTLSFSDNVSGVAATYYRINTGAWLPYGGGFTLSGDGSYVVEFFSVDFAGNPETPGSATYVIDTTPPAITLYGVDADTTYGAPVTPTATTDDPTATLVAYLDGDPFVLGTQIADEGAHVLMLVATDPAGNTSTLVASFVLDFTAPDVAVIGVAEGGLYNHAVTPDATTADPAAVLTATLNGDPFTPGTEVNLEGTYTFLVTATDTAGNVSTASATFTIDLTAPDLTVTGVVDGGLYSASVTPDASSTDPTAVLTATLNGDPFTLGSAVSGDGTYTLVVTATDPAGNAVFETRTFTIDTTAPDVTVTGVADGGLYNAAVNPDASSTDPTAVLAATLNGDPFTLGSEVAAAGSYTLVVTAADPAGNTATQTVKFTIDTTAPDLTVTGVTDGGLYNAAVNPDASSTDPTAVLAATLNGDPFTLGSAVGLDGAYTLVVTATDPAGNTATQTVKFTIDATAPDLTITGVTDAGLYNAAVNPDASSTDPTAVLVATLNGDPFTLGSAVSLDGDYTLVVTATDPAGNTATQTVKFTIDTTEPDVTVTGVTDGGLYNAAVNPDASSTDPTAVLNATLNGDPFTLGSAVSLDGAYTLVVTATDPAGNTATQTVSFMIDLTNPGVAVSGVADGGLYNTTVFPDATSPDPLAIVSATLDGMPWPLGAEVTDEGTHTFVATAIDLAGNFTTASATFVLDFTAPDVNVIGVTDGGLYGAAVNPDASSTDPTAVLAATLNGDPFTLGSSVSLDGNYTLVVTATDAAGNTATETVKFTIDATAPDLAVTGVTDGGLYNAAVNPDASSTDPTAVLTATLNGDPFTLGSAVSLDGDYTLVVKATDAVGNATTQTVKFTIDATAPDLAVTGVTDGGLYNAAVNPDASSTDPTAVLTATLNGDPFTLGSAVSLDGDYTLVVTATDAAGNTATQTVKFTIDATAPDLAVTGVTDGGLYNAAVNPDASSTDPTAVLTATLNGDPFTLGSAVSLDDAYTLVVTATDLAGNATTQTVKFTIDTTAPVITITGVTDGDVSAGPVTPEVAVDDPAAVVVVTLDGSPYVPGTPVVGDGVHTLVVTATDPAGNTATTTISFTIDSAAPDVIVTGVTDGGLYSAPVTPDASSTDPTAVLTATLNGTPYVLGTELSTDGDYTLVVTATNSEGKSAVATVTFTIDTTAPDLTVTGVTDGGLYNAAVTPGASSNDPTAVITATLDGDPFTLGTEIGLDGTYALVVTATDPAGNATSTALTFTIDTTPPAISLFGVDPDTAYNAPVTPTATTDDPTADVVAYLNGDPFVLGTEITAEGLYTLTVVATDPAGNVSTLTVNFALDLTVPDVTITGVVDGSVYNAPVTPGATTTDPFALVTATLNGDPYVFGTEVSADGTYTFVATAIDEAGNTATASATFTIDSLGPDLTVTGVVDGGLYNAPVTPDASSTDPTAVLNATLNGDPFTLDTRITADGTYTLVVTATDSSGNATTQTLTFTVDTTAPVVTVTGVNDGDVTADPVTPGVTVDDPTATVVATLNGDPYVPGTEIAAQGTYTLVVTATDPAGNVTIVTVTFTIDTTAPDLTVTGVVDGGLYNAPVTPDASSTDPTAVLTATLNGDPFPLGTAVTADGTYTLVVTATDPADNATTATLTFTIDTTAPDLTVTGVVDGGLYNAPVTPDASSSDPTAVLTATLNGAPYVLGTGITSDGTYTLVVTATDPAGNATAETRSFTIDATAPDLKITGVADGGLYNKPVTPNASSTDPTAVITATLNGFPYTLGTPVGADGTYTLEVTATDAAGNATVVTATFTIDSSVIDNTAPDLTVTGVADGGLYNAAVTPDASSTDPTAIITATLNGDPFTLGTAIGTDGTYTLSVTATDPSGNATIETLTFTIDTQAPDITVTGVKDGARYNHSVFPDATSTDPTAVLSATLDGMPWVLGAEVTDEGSHTFVVTAFDLAGNFATASVTFELDFTAPDVTVTGVVDGGLYNTPVTPDAWSTDPTAVVSATLNGKPYTLDTRISPDGTYTLVVTATDPAGNVTTESMTFTIDRTAPDLTVTGVVDGGVYDRAVTPDASSSDPAAVLAATLNGDPFTLDTVVSADGDYTLVVTATDPAGNVTTKTLQFTIDTANPDTTAPDLTVTGVSDGAHYKAAVTPDASSSDPTAVLAATLNGDPFTLGTEVTADGTYTLVVTATDPAGNATTKTVVFTIDTSAPDVVVIDVADGASYDGPVTPHASSSDPDAVLTATLNGAPYVLGTEITTPGTYTLVVTATDPAGNTATSTVTFTINPAVDPDAPAAPTNLTAIPAGPSALLDWNDNTEPDLAGYNVYRATSITGPWTLITASPVTESAYTDTPIDMSRQYFYYVTAVDTTGNESGPSNIDDVLSLAAVVRVGGANRYVVSAGISSRSFKSADVVMIATGENFPDALSASSLAGFHHAPLLLVTKDVVSPEVVAEIARLGATKAIIVGGPLSVGLKVEASLKATGLAVERVTGANRYVVARGVASQVSQLQGDGFSDTAFLARGDLYTDALSVSPLAYKSTSPVLLTMPTSIDQETLDLIVSLGFKKVVIVGGLNSVSQGIENKVKALGVDVVRLGGEDRFAASYNVSQYGYSAGIVGKRYVSTATGYKFADALTGGISAGEKDGVIMLTTPDAMHPLEAQLLTANKLQIDEFVVVGGPMSVSDKVLATAKSILQSQTP